MANLTQLRQTGPHQDAIDLLIQRCRQAMQATERCDEKHTKVVKLLRKHVAGPPCLILDWARQFIVSGTPNGCGPTLAQIREHVLPYFKLHGVGQLLECRLQLIETLTRNQENAVQTLRLVD